MRNAHAVQTKAARTSLGETSGRAVLPTEQRPEQGRDRLAWRSGQGSSPRDRLGPTRRAAPRTLPRGAWPGGLSLVPRPHLMLMTGSVLGAKPTENIRGQVAPGVFPSGSALDGRQPGAVHLSPQALSSNHLVTLDLCSFIHPDLDSRSSMCC